MTARVLVVGRAVRPSGYARVLHELCARLAGRFEIVHFGINYRGPVREGAWRVEPNRLPGDVLGLRQVPALVERFDPDVVLLCHDWSFWAVHEATLTRARATSIFYCPVEWPFADPASAARLATVDRLVLYTEYGRAMATDAFARARVAPPRMDVVPHGLDTRSFAPLAGGTSRPQLRDARRAARRALWPDRPELDDAFVVLNANRNVRRKRADLTLEAFARVARDAPDAYLVLHMGRRDAGWPVDDVVRRLGIAERVLVTAPGDAHPHVDDATLNAIYNAADVGLNTSTGEGWGLVAFEHAATGAAQVLPAHAVAREVWGDAAELVPVDGEPAGAVDVDATAAALLRLRRDRDLLHARSLAAYARATDPALAWDSIARTWAELLEHTKVALT